jgi:hypothetical protein
LTALLTIIIASFTDLYVSSRYWAAPPLKTRVVDFVLLHPVNILYLSFPNWTSSNFPQIPSTSSVKPWTVVYNTAPVAFATLYKSSFYTLPAQKISLSAKY